MFHVLCKIITERTFVIINNLHLIQLLVSHNTVNIELVLKYSQFNLISCIERSSINVASFVIFNLELFTVFRLRRWLSKYPLF